MKSLYGIGIRNWYQETIAYCFEKSAKKGYLSYDFAEKFLNSEWGSNLLLEKKYTICYESAANMFAHAIKELDVKKGKIYDPYVMWMYGYLVKFWVTNYNITPQKIWEVLPINVFNARFMFYHTQGWHYIIQNAITRYNEDKLGKDKVSIKRVFYEK